MKPLIRDRIAIASSAKADENPEDGIASIAIWTSVTEEVDAEICEQIKAGVFPKRLSGEEWTGGTMAIAVTANFEQVVKEGNPRIHSIVDKIYWEHDLKNIIK